MPRSLLKQENRAKPAPRKAETTPPAQTLVAWYRTHHRKIPWRAEPGQKNDPYRVWLSEIMLQQTTVPTVVSYYEKFLRLWPRVGDLASAPVEDVLKHWAGLGYYARARNLHKCAQTVINTHDGQFPASVEGLLDLPGIGPYTASAVGAMAFGLPTVPVDGNVERVITRLHMIQQPVRQAKPQIKALAQSLHDSAPDVFSGDLAQALMDLGATICTPRTPQCHACPLSAQCSARAAGRQTDFPVPEEKKPKPTRYGRVYLLHDGHGQYLLERREGKGLLGGMLGLPTTEWVDGNQNPQDPWPLQQAEVVGQVRHTFTHFHLILQVVTGRAPSGADASAGLWYDQARLKDAGLPKVFLKALPFILK